MFTSLHALAKQATLMITIAAEGDDLVRVNVAPVPADTKSKAKLPQPLSLLATPAEFDADFIAVLATWQAPKRTLLQQAQDATGGAQAPAAMLPAPAAAAGSDSKAGDKPQEKAKPGRKARADKSGGAEQQPAGLQAAGEAAGAAGAAADDVMVVAAAASAPVADGDLEKVDTHTLDMFVAPDAASAPAPAPAGHVPVEVEDNQVAPLNDCF
jgi:PRTRC genetic system protein E